MPVAAVIGGRIFCVHGGLSPDLYDLKQINQIKRPFEFVKNSLCADLLWSDPSILKGWNINAKRGTSYLYGPDKINDFLKKNDFDLICRSHQVVEDGYEFFNDRKLVTIFSAPNYCNMYYNQGAVLVVQEDLSCCIKQFHNVPPNGIKVQRTKRACTPLKIKRKRSSLTDSASKN